MQMYLLVHIHSMNTLVLKDAVDFYVHTVNADLFINTHLFNEQIHFK